MPIGNKYNRAFGHLNLFCPGVSALIYFGQIDKFDILDQAGLDSTSLSLMSKRECTFVVEDMEPDI